MIYGWADALEERLGMAWSFVIWYALPLVIGSAWLAGYFMGGASLGFAVVAVVALEEVAVTTRRAYLRRLDRAH